METFLSTTILVLSAITIGCSGENEPKRKGEREHRKERILLLIAGKSQMSNVIHTHRFVGDFGLTGTFTTIERRNSNYEYGAYDTVWVPGQRCYYGYIDYSFHSSYGKLDFMAAWPIIEADTLFMNDTVPVQFLMIERRRTYRSDSTTTITTNLDSAERIKQIVGYSIDTVKQQPLDVEISYELLGIQPMKFFVDIRLGGYSLYTYSPQSSIVY